MAHSDFGSEADGAASFDNLNDAAAAFGDYFNEHGSDLPDDEEEDAPAHEADDLEADDAPDEGAEEAEEASEDEEPAAPAIPAPVSWDAEAKEVFAQLPPELQAKVAERESQREKFLTTKAEESANARKIAEKAFADYDSSTRAYAERLEAVANAILPEKPDWALAASDPQAFAARMAHYEAATAQYQQLMQQSGAAKAEAEKAFEVQQQRAIQEDAQRTMQDLPEMADPQAWSQLLQTLTPVAKALGYDDERIAQAWPSDILAIKRVADFKSKADKWDALQAKRMEGVRAAKVSKPGTAQPKGSARARGYHESIDRLRETGDIKDAAAAFGRLAR